MLEYIVTLAAVLLPDLHDQHALSKVRLETYRLQRYLSQGDLPNAKMALCDMVFYTALAFHNHLLSRLEAMEKIMFCANLLGFSILDALEMTETKYIMRIQTEKVVDVEAEREALDNYETL